MNNVLNRHIEEFTGDTMLFDINCKDPLDRSALVSSIENENFEMIMILLESNVQVKVSFSSYLNSAPNPPVT